MYLFTKYPLHSLSIITIILYGSIFFSPYYFPTQVVTTGVTFMYLFGACLMIILYKITQKKAPLPIEKTPTLHSKKYIFLLGISSIFLSILLQSIVFLIESIFTGTQASSENTQSIMKIILLNPLFVLATTIGGPIMEEFVFRRSLIGLFESSVGFWFSAIISSSLFSLIHQDGHFFVYFSLGLFFSFLYKLTGSIWTPIIAHCGMNALVVTLQLIVHYAAQTS